jgi:dTDP-4-dehydrorhamnose 3,5-epimerase
MICSDTALPEVKLITPRVFGDARGFFFEAFNQASYAAQGLPTAFVQTNVSRSARGVLRGLHYQWPQPQGKLVGVLEGSVIDVAVDIRVGSPTFGKHVAVELSADNHQMLWIPEGFAHGFAVTSEYATFVYQCTALYQGAYDRAIAWNDEALAIAWPFTEASLSAKDAAAPRLADVPHELLPGYR